MSSPPAETHIVVARDGLHTEWFVDGEFAAAILDPGSGVRHHLDGSASAVWALCETPTSVDDLVHEVRDLGAGPEQARAVVTAAVEAFTNTGLLESNDPAPEPGDVAHDNDEVEYRPLPPEGDPETGRATARGRRRGAT